MFQFNDHSKLRAAQRGLSPEEIGYILRHGAKYHRTGVVIYYLRWKDIPPGDLRFDFCARLEGSAVILDQVSQTIITVWRNRRNGLKRIRIKVEYRWGGSQKPGLANRRRR